VGEQREREGLRLGEALVVLGGVEGDPEHVRPRLRQLWGSVTEPLPLPRSARGGGLGIPPQHDPPPGVVAKAHGTAVLVGQLEVGGGAAGLEHPVMLSGRPTTVQCVPDTPPPARQAVGIDVVAVGSAIVDVLAETEDQVLGRLGLLKGTMALVDSASADRREPADIDAGLIADSRLVYLVGYLWDPPQAKQALRRTVALARETGAEVALTLSDPFCVERHREEFLELIDSGVGVLFANAVELTSLFQVGGLDQA